MMYQTYCATPAFVDAVQVTADYALKRLTHQEKWPDGIRVLYAGYHAAAWTVACLQIGDRTRSVAELNDWILTHEDGKTEVMRHEIFQDRYILASNSPFARLPVYELLGLVSESWMILQDRDYDGDTRSELRQLFDDALAKSRIGQTIMHTSALRIKMEK